MEISSIILLSLLLLYLYNTYNKTTTYVTNSKIQGEGLFASKNFVKDDIILEDIFPHKNYNEELYEPITKSLFNKYISYEGSKINHCLRNDNSYVSTDDYKIYQLRAKKDILKYDEITVNYNVTHDEYPFIAEAKEEFNLC